MTERRSSGFRRDDGDCGLALESLSSHNPAVQIWGGRIRGEGEPATIGRTCSTAKLWPSRSMGKEQTRMNDPVLIAIACGLLAVLYGFITSRQVLGAPAGNEKMQEIARPEDRRVGKECVRTCRSRWSALH